MYKHAVGGSWFSAFKRDRFHKTLPGSGFDPEILAAKAAKARQRNSEPSLEPTEREKDTLDVGRGETENKSLFWSVIAQVELRERRHAAIKKKIEKAKICQAKSLASRLSNNRSPENLKSKSERKK